MSFAFSLLCRSVFLAFGGSFLVVAQFALIKLVQYHEAGVDAAIRLLVWMVVFISAFVRLGRACKLGLRYDIVIQVHLWAICHQHVLIQVVDHLGGLVLLADVDVSFGTCQPDVFPARGIVVDAATYLARRSFDPRQHSRIVCLIHRQDLLVLSRRVCRRIRHGLSGTRGLVHVFINVLVGLGRRRRVKIVLS